MKNNIIKKVIKSFEKKFNMKMGSQGFEPRSWDFSCLSTPIDHHNGYCSVTRIFLQRQLESQMMPGYTITPHITYNNKYILMIYKHYHLFKFHLFIDTSYFIYFQTFFQRIILFNLIITVSGSRSIFRL